MRYFFPRRHFENIKCQWFSPSIKHKIIFRIFEWRREEMWARIDSSCSMFRRDPWLSADIRTAIQHRKCLMRRDIKLHPLIQFLLFCQCWRYLAEIIFSNHRKDFCSIVNGQWSSSQVIPPVPVHKLSSSSSRVKVLYKDLKVELGWHNHLVAFLNLKWKKVFHCLPWPSMVLHNCNDACLAKPLHITHLVCRYVVIW